MFFNLPIHSFNLIFISRKHLSCLLSNWNQWPRRGTCYRATRWRAVGPILPLTINQTYPCRFNPLFRDSRKVLHAPVLLFIPQICLPLPCRSLYSWLLPKWTNTFELRVLTSNIWNLNSSSFVRFTFYVRLEHFHIIRNIFSCLHSNGKLLELQVLYHIEFVIKVLIAFRYLTMKTVERRMSDTNSSSNKVPWLKRRLSKENWVFRNRKSSTEVTRRV